MRRKLLSGFAAALALASCQCPTHGGRDTIELVKALAADPGSPEHTLLAGNAKPSSSGDIYIIGTEEACTLISSRFADCDIVENARGRNWGDGLKDFAGETFACVLDDAFSPYQEYAAANGREALREHSVRLALASLSPRCNVSVYDLEGNYEKRPAKMLLLADPWMLDSGKFDIDTLFALTSCNVPVVSPQELLFNAALGGEKKYFNLGIACDSLYLQSGIYKSLFEAKAREFDVVGARSFQAASAGSAGTLAGFLDSYVAAGNTAPLDAVLIDDWNVDTDSLKVEISAIRDFNREEYMNYGKLISPGFTVFTSSAETLAYCYKILRQRSLFTHIIAQPRQCAYTIKTAPESSAGSFLMIPVENVQN